MKCQVCARPDRAAIEAEVLKDAKSISQVAAGHGVPVASMYRHVRTHMVKAVAKADQNRGNVALAAIMGRLERTACDLEYALAAAKSMDYRQIPKAADSLARNLELAAKLTGLLRDKADEPKIHAVIILPLQVPAGTRPIPSALLLPPEQVGDVIDVEVMEASEGPGEEVSEPIGKIQDEVPDKVPTGVEIIPKPPRRSRVS